MRKGAQSDVGRKEEEERTKNFFFFFRWFLFPKVSKLTCGTKWGVVVCVCFSFMLVWILDRFAHPKKTKNFKRGYKCC